MLLKKSKSLPIIFVISMLTGTATQASLPETFIHNIVAAIGYQSGKHAADYLWTNYRKELLIGVGVAIAVWYWKKSEDKKDRSHKKVCSKRTCYSQ